MESLRRSLILPIALWLCCSCALASCAPLAAEEVNQGVGGTGGSTPQDVATSFFEDFNAALQDDALANEERQEYWAERLSGYFAPNERRDQRYDMAQTLAVFASGAGQLEMGQRLEVEILYSSIELVRQDTSRASVRLVDGELHFKLVRMVDQSPQLLREDQRPLAETIGQPNGLIPLVRVSGRWFLTEG